MQYPENKSVFEKLQKTQEAYLVQKAYNQTQEEILTFERQQSLTFRDKLVKATKAFIALDKVHKSSVEELHKKIEQLNWEKNKLEEENAKLEKKSVELKACVSQLQDQCEHFRAVQMEHIQDTERIWKLEDELEVTKAQRELQQEIHRKEIDALKKRHISEMLKYKISFENVRQKFRDGKRSRLGKGSRGAFRWPSLGVEKIGSTQVREEDIEEVEIFHPAFELDNRNSAAKRKETTVEKSQENVEPARKKRRKLFHQDHEEVFDLFNP